MKDRKDIEENINRLVEINRKEPGAANFNAGFCWGVVVVKWLGL